MTDPVTRQSAAGLGAPFPQYREPPPPPPRSTPVPRARRKGHPHASVVPFPRLSRRHVRTHGGRRHA